MHHTDMHLTCGKYLIKHQNTTTHYKQWCTFNVSSCDAGQTRSASRPDLFNLLKATGYVMHQQVLTFNKCTLCPHCIYVFFIYLRTNSDLYHLQHKLIGFYNGDEKCLQRGTDWGL